MSGDERMCVFDFGAGTCDVAVLVRDGVDGFTVTGSGGDNNFGGRDLDARLARWVLDEAAELDPELPQRLRALAAMIALADHVRTAKEALSDTAQAVVELPGTGRTLLLTRREFEAMITPFVDRAVELTRDAIARADSAGTGPKGPVNVYVTGGTQQHRDAAVGAGGRRSRGPDRGPEGRRRPGRAAALHQRRPLGARVGIGTTAGTRNAVRTGNTAGGPGTGHRVAFPNMPSGSVIAGVLVRSGQSVRAGEPLATLDTPQGRLALDAPMSGTLHGVDLRVGIVARPGVVFAAIGPADLRPEQWPQLHRVPAGVSVAPAGIAVCRPTGGTGSAHPRRSGTRSSGSRQQVPAPARLQSPRQQMHRARALRSGPAHDERLRPHRLRGLRDPRRSRRHPGRPHRAAGRLNRTSGHLRRRPGPSAPLR
ncbi:Hsp70 family protein [Gordonia sp. B21]|uniref:Hsp70 family protein n=1 Tax=Gordonia sp. B21 TaxID=3151852 RepID=UPI003266B94E